MRIIFIGAPNSGKGTQSAILSDHFSIPIISPGNEYRRQIELGTEIGILASQTINKGNFMPDNTTNEMVSNRIKESDCKNGFIFDGYPRSQNQLDAIDYKIDMVIELKISIDLIIKRSKSRWVHSSGRSYNEIFNPPKVHGLDDITGEKLTQREDDLDENIVRNRISIYQEKTEVLKGGLMEIANYITINADKNIGEVTEDILSCASKINT